MDRRLVGQFDWAGVVVIHILDWALRIVDAIDGVHVSVDVLGVEGLRHSMLQRKLSLTRSVVLTGFGAEWWVTSLLFLRSWRCDVQEVFGLWLSPDGLLLHLLFSVEYCVYCLEITISRTLVWTLVKEL